MKSYLEIVWRSLHYHIGLQVLGQVLIGNNINIHYLYRSLIILNDHHFETLKVILPVNELDLYLASKISV